MEWGREGSEEIMGGVVVPGALFTAKKVCRSSVFSWRPVLLTASRVVEPGTTLLGAWDVAHTPLLGLGLRR
ncbi:hypothetical protein RJ40_04740 [Methanofollis aquaemaris]|uniref:Uncharacterized protein n=1 Tax=Methanofollis aquaemaris TaxID=126734 RepID=A0A8A3S4Q1_9EURY|nr:hypothetical protein [Methanofollis aquaemaris]QSZ66849.1 hypothetical protein RJ40_04740 [Methanofollis aquaemaris]